jgi:nucleotide-binding universal stress UspA family protein
MVTTSDTASPDRSFKRVLLCVDPSLASMHAAEYLCGLGLSEAKCRVLSVVENPRVFLPAHSTGGFNVASLYASLEESASTCLEKTKQIFLDHDVKIDAKLVDLAKSGGDLAHMLVAETEAWGADLIVLGARQHHGLLRWVEGCVSEPVTRLSTCAVLIVPEGYRSHLQHGPKRIMFAVDGSPACEDALNTGVRLAATNAHLRALFVVDRAVHFADIIPIDHLEESFVQEGKLAIAKAEHIFSGLRADIHSDTGFLRTKRIDDDIPHTIVREAARWPADLLVLGTHGRRGVSRWILGSIASRVARITETPLLLVRAHSDAAAAPTSTLKVKSLWSRP